MTSDFRKIWNLAKVYLKKGKRKDFVLHTEGVVEAMEALIKSEGGDKNILMPAAILHDVGWAKVPVKLEKSKNKIEQKRGMQLHIDYAPEIVRKILLEVSYPENQIKEIIEIIIAHKFKNPRMKNKRLLIDADTLAEAFKRQFWNDVESHGCSALDNYNFRIKNKFYFKKARILFKKEMEQRRKEIECV